MFSKLFIVALAAASVVSAAPAQVDTNQVPDGMYEGITYSNGTTIFNNVDSTISAREFRVENGEQAPESALGKRAASCYGNILNTVGVDAGVRQLKAWAGSGKTLVAPSGGTRFKAFNNNGVQVYYCINSPGKAGSCSAGDVDFANGKMDSACRRFEAGHYAFDTSKYEIIGKAASFAGICLG